MRAIEIYDAALNGIEAHDIREDREIAERERALLEGQKPPRIPARPGALGHRPPRG